MTAALMPFDYDGQTVRTVLIDGEPWFVLADLCAALGLTSPTRVAERVDANALSSAQVIDSMGRNQTATTVNESGMYEVVIRSDKPEAVTFRRWITGIVLPQIRRTGSYTAPETREQLLARAVLESQAALAEKDERIAELEPKARTFDTFLGSMGDYSVNEAAKVLSRDHSILTGERRLFAYMEQLGWLYRDGRGKPVPYQAQIDNGRLVAKSRFHFHPETGEQVIDSPQVRITAKGLEALHVKHTAVSA